MPLWKRKRSPGKQLVTRSKHLSASVRGALPRTQPRQPRIARIASGVAGGLLGITVGGLAVASRFGSDVVPLDRSLDAGPHIYSWRGWRVVFYENGPDGATPIVLVHSINAAASAYEMRAPFARLGDRYKIYALDLLGFGASERPPIRYTPDLYVDLLIDFLREVSGSAHVVATSLSGAFAVQAANRSPELFKSLLLINPAGVASLTAPQNPAGKLVEQLYRIPIIGQGLFNVLVSRPSLRYFTRQIYSDPAFVEHGLIEQYYLAAHQPGARYAPAAFIGGGLNTSIRDDLARLQPRALVLWSGYNRLQNIDREREAFHSANPGLRTEVFEDSGGLPQDEQRERFENLLRDWIAQREVPGGQQTQQRVG